MKRPKQPKRLKVGVTLHLRSGHQSLWENGIFQNCFFLIMLLNKSPLIDRAYLVNGGEGKPEESAEFLAMAPGPVIGLDAAMRQLDVVIELSSQLNPDWATGFRERGGRVVGMRVANDYVIDIERMIFDLPHGLLMSGTPYDAVWTLPAFGKTCLSYYKTGLRAPVTAMQHLWSPVLLERSVAALSPPRRFGYAPGRKRWRLAILEPNICMVKTSHLPMLLCDVAHRQDPDFIEYLRTYNAMSLKEHANFVDFARSLDLVRHGIATFEPRYATYEIMTTQADAIVAHHWENAQNYIYYEALYGGYPLIHNSTMLGGCGYYYPDFDCDEGALALRQAFHEHDERLADYQGEAQTFLETLNPESDRNVAAYSAALSNLFNEG